MYRNDKLKMLIANGKSWIVSEQSEDRHGKVSMPSAVGLRLLDFVNEDFSGLEWTGKIIDKFLNRLDDAIDDDGCFADTERLQSLTLNVITRLEETRISAGGLLQAFVQKLLNFESALYYELAGRSRNRLQEAIRSAFSDLQELLPFQKEFKDALATIALAGRPVTECRSDGSADAVRIDNAQLLWRVFRDIPELTYLCTGNAGYMIANVDDNGEIIEEMLDIPLASAFNIVLKKDQELLREDRVKYNKTIFEFYEITDIRRIVLIDLIEALRCGMTISCCRTCGKFFWSQDRRRTYCDNFDCSVGRERTRNYQKALKDDPFLEEAEKYRKAVRERHKRDIGTSSTDESKKKRRKRVRSLSYSEYDDYLKMFGAQIARYKHIKMDAVLRDDKDKIIEEAGRRLLEKTRPQDYVSKKRKKSGGNFPLVLT